MANDNVIDELSLRIEANANVAMKSLGDMQKQLRHLAKDLGTVSAAGRGLSSLATSFKAVGNINTDNMRKAINQLQRLSKIEFKPLDSRTIKVDTASIEKQLSGSLTNATKKKYNIDVASIGKLAESLKMAGDSMSALSATNPNVSGLTNAVNALKRFSEVDMSKFNTDTFSSIVNGIQGISQIGDVSSAVNRLVSSLARLASAGGDTRTTAKFLPALGEALKTVAGRLSSVGGLPAELNAFVSSIGQLANAGNKTSATASQLGVLGEALRNFIISLSDVPEVSDNVIQMANALAQLANVGGRAGTAAKNINNAVANVGKGSDTATNRLSALKNIINDLGNVFRRAGSWIKSSASRMVSSLSEIRNAGLSLNGATNSIKNMIAAMIGFRGVQGLAHLSKEVIRLGGDLTEIDHIVESVFGDMAQYVDSWSKSAIEKFGIASQNAKQYAGTLSAMFQASGLAQRDAGMMGVKLTELAGDLSAFYNIDTETAFKKIQSGMAGMVRPLRDLGIDLTAATLQEYAQTQGITTKYNAMTQAEKVMLRYNYLIHATTLQSGDFERTNRRIKRAA